RAGIAFGSPGSRAARSRRASLPDSPPFRPPLGIRVGYSALFPHTVEWVNEISLGRGGGRGGIARLSRLDSARDGRTVVERRRHGAWLPGSARDRMGRLERAQPVARRANTAKLVGHPAADRG